MVNNSVQCSSDFDASQYQSHLNPYHKHNSSQEVQQLDFNENNDEISYKTQRATFTAGIDNREDQKDKYMTQLNERIMTSRRYNIDKRYFLIFLKKK